MGTYANFYNSDNNDRVYNADSFSEWLRPFFKNGVFNGELQVVADTGMNVKVRTGNAYIDGKMKNFENETTLTLEKASANSTRIDSVVVRRNDTERDFSILVVKGSTSAPDPVRQEGIYDLVLAQITVGASVTEIKQANITDTRMNADLCGWVVTNVNEIDFSQITSQWSNYIANFEAEQLQAFQTWFDTIKGQLGSDVAGSLQTQINNINSDISSLQSTVSTNTSDINSTNAKVNELSQNVSGLQTDVSGLQTDVSGLQTKSFEGTSGTIETKGGYIHDLMIFGKSVQDGTPTPDNPIEIQSVVNPKVTISNSDSSLTQVATLTYTLNAIPVSSGGNVTINGQQYISDYVDIERKKLVRNVGIEKFTSNGNYQNQNSDYDNNNSFFISTRSNSFAKKKLAMLCERFVKTSVDCQSASYSVIANIFNQNVNYKEYGNYLYFRCPYDVFGVTKNSTYAEKENAFKTWLDAIGGLIIYYELATPKQINLTDEEVAQFKALKTYEPTTSVITSSDVLAPKVSFDYSLNKETNNIYDRLQDNASDVLNINTRLNGLTFVALTQTEYDALSTKDDNTIYFITEG